MGTQQPSLSGADVQQQRVRVVHNHRRPPCRRHRHHGHKVCSLLKDLNRLPPPTPTPTFRDLTMYHSHSRLKSFSQGNNGPYPSDPLLMPACPSLCCPSYDFITNRWPRLASPRLSPPLFPTTTTTVLLPYHHSHATRRSGIEIRPRAPLP